MERYSMNGEGRQEVVEIGEGGKQTKGGDIKSEKFLQYMYFSVSGTLKKSNRKKKVALNYRNSKQTEKGSYITKTLCRCNSVYTHQT